MLGTPLPPSSAASRDQRRDWSSVTTRKSMKTWQRNASSSAYRPFSHISRQERMYSMPPRQSRKIAKAPGSLGRASPSPRHFCARVRPPSRLHRERRGGAHPAPRLRVAVVVEDQGPLIPAPVGIREHVLVDAALRAEEVVQEEALHAAEQVAPPEQGEYLALVPQDKVTVDHLVPVGATELHPVLFPQAFDLAVGEHGEARHGCHQRAHAEVLVPVPELLDGGLLVGVAHEVHEALEDLGIELQRVADGLPVAGVVLRFQHVHERAVVHPVHAEGADEETFQEPERFRQQQRVGSFPRHAVHHLPPELLRHGAVEIAARKPVAGPGRDVSARARLGEPQPLEVLLGEGHGGVEPDDREHPRHVEDGLEITASRVSGFRKSSCAVSFHGMCVPSFPW